MSQLFLVSIGPGDAELISPKARAAIESSTDLVSYGYYLDLLGASCDGKTAHDLPLGEEIGRAELAIKLASEGKVTALISSGDIGIYAMATLVFEVLDRDNISPNFEIEVIPGISAMQASSSRVGAMLGHDFCTISLSDLLTPWETIEQRVDAAGRGDFVVSFYNPVSKKRDWQLNAARDILLKYRPAETPVILGRQLTREDEAITFTTLGQLDAKDVDMFTLVSVGNCETKTFTANDRQWLYTPRGYAKKLG